MNALLAFLAVVVVASLLALAALALARMREPAAPRRRTMGMIALAIASLGVASMALASPVSGFFTWTGTGNGRGGQAAAKPACTNDYRGRTWALYAASSASSDQFQVCLYTSGGGNVWVAVPR